MSEVERILAGAPRPRSDRRILDVGCGTGLLLDRLEPFGCVEGIEPDPLLIRDSNQRERLRLARLDADLEIDEPRDLILLLDVLEHIEDDLSALIALNRGLRKDGRLLLTVPALSYLWSRHDEVNRHHRRYGARTLRNRLEAAGFEVERLRYAFFWTVAPLLARRWLFPGGARGAYRVRIPPKLVNRSLELLSLCDHRLGRGLKWPIGGSLLAVAKPSARRSATARRETSLVAGSA